MSTHHPFFRLGSLNYDTLERPLIDTASIHTGPKVHHPPSPQQDAYQVPLHKTDRRSTRHNAFYVAIEQVRFSTVTYTQQFIEIATQCICYLLSRLQFSILKCLPPQQTRPSFQSFSEHVCTSAMSHLSESIFSVLENYTIYASSSTLRSVSPIQNPFHLQNSSLGRIRVHPAIPIRVCSAMAA